MWDISYPCNQQDIYDEESILNVASVHGKNNIHLSKSNICAKFPDALITVEDIHHKDTILSAASVYDKDTVYLSKANLKTKFLFVLNK